MKTRSAIYRAILSTYALSLLLSACFSEKKISDNADVDKNANEQTAAANGPSTPTGLSFDPSTNVLSWIGSKDKNEDGIDAEPNTISYKIYIVQDKSAPLPPAPTATVVGIHALDIGIAAQDAANDGDVFVTIIAIDKDGLASAPSDFMKIEPLLSERRVITTGQSPHLDVRNSGASSKDLKILGKQIVTKIEIQLSSKIIANQANDPIWKIAMDLDPDHTFVKVSPEEASKQIMEEDNEIGLPCVKLDLSKRFNSNLENTSDNRAIYNFGDFSWNEDKKLYSISDSGDRFFPIPKIGNVKLDLLPTYPLYRCGTKDDDPILLASPQPIHGFTQRELVGHFSELKFNLKSDELILGRRVVDPYLNASPGVTTQTCVLKLYDKNSKMIHEIVVPDFVVSNQDATMEYIAINKSNYSSFTATKKITAGCTRTISIQENDDDTDLIVKLELESDIALDVTSD